MAKSTKELVKQTVNKTLSENVSAAIIISTLEKKAKPFEKKLESIEINSKEAYDEAARNLKLLKEYSKQAEEKRKSIINPLNKAIQEVNLLFQPFRDRVATLEKVVKAAMSIFIESQKNKQAQLEKKFEEGSIKSISIFSKQSLELQVSSDNAKIRKVWTLEIENVAKIPREFLVPDEDKIKQYIKETGKIPTGCKWYQKKTIVI